jgi:hypothetical protein
MKGLYIMQISKVSKQLYDALKQLYELIDHNKNPNLEEGEFILHEVQYYSEIQRKIRNALKDYEDCQSIYK